MALLRAAAAGSVDYRWLVGILASALIAIVLFVGGIVVHEVIKAREEARQIDRRLDRLEAQTHRHAQRAYGPRENP